MLSETSSFARGVQEPGGGSTLLDLALRLWQFDKIEEEYLATIRIAQGKILPWLPRPATFRRQISETRERWIPAGPHSNIIWPELKNHPITPIVIDCLDEYDSCEKVYELLFDLEQNDEVRSQLKPYHIGARPLNRNSKAKRGLSGFVNGSRKSALADTGAAQNVISSAFAKEMELQIEESPSLIKLGNSKKTRSLGAVSMKWSFAEKPAEIFNIVCHVLPHCTYDLILGSEFLTATETMSKYRRRVTECIFSTANLFHINFLGNDSQYLRGSLADRYTVIALPDTGADVNVIDKSFAMQRGLKIQSEPDHCGLVEFADGSSEETLGQVTTSWTFESGKRINLRFEVLENLCSNIIIGENVLWEHNVFNDHASSIVSISCESDNFLLAPFTYLPNWFKKSAKSRPSDKTCLTSDVLKSEERTRRALWNNEFGFGGANASLVERKAENDRRRKYEEKLEPLQGQPPPHQRTNTPRILSIPTSSRQRHPSSREPP